MDKNVQPGDTVKLQRGEGWLTGAVILIKRRTWIHIRVGDDFTGYRTYRASLYDLKGVAK